MYHVCKRIAASVIVPIRAVDRIKDGLDTGLFSLFERVSLGDPQFRLSLRVSVKGRPREPMALDSLPMTNCSCQLCFWLFHAALGGVEPDCSDG